MPSNLDLARDFYAAHARADADRLRELLHPQFTGHVTGGTPSGPGGTHPGPTAMLRDVGSPSIVFSPPGSRRRGSSAARAARWS